MAATKKNIYTINLSDQAIWALQDLGILDKRKKLRKSQNFSQFISQRIIEYFQAYKNDPKGIEKRFLLSCLMETDVDIKVLEERRQQLVEKIEKLRGGANGN